jgi:hypothetical protein
MNTMLFIIGKVRLMGLELIDLSDFTKLIFRFLLNFGVMLILIRWLYYSTAKRKDYLFTFMMISSIIFLLCYLLNNVKLELGFALGLFAIFGIIRYRTDAMPIKEMTYLFVVIGISVINALANKKSSIAEISLTNLIIVLIAIAYEKVFLLKHESAKIINYDKINLILPECYSEMIDDLKKRTGIKNITHVEVGKIDLLRDTCRLKIYYEEANNQINLEDQAESAGSIDDNDD